MLLMADSSPPPPKAPNAALADYHVIIRRMQWKVLCLCHFLLLEHAKETRMWGGPMYRKIISKSHCHGPVALACVMQPAT